MRLIRSDLEFIISQIRAAEAGDAPSDPSLPFGLRTVSGVDNSLVPGQSEFGSADRLFPRLVEPVFRPAEAGSSHAQTAGTVTDSQPRVISNLVAETDPSRNPAAGALDSDRDGVIPNVAPETGAAPFNQWFTFFGQFFDHGLDLVKKGDSGSIFVPLHPDDPLFAPASGQNFMVVTRATNQPGPDGVVGTADDIREQTNQTTPFVDQNQTYTSHPSHQVFLREYVLDDRGRPVATGRLLDGEDGGLPTWADVKAQARDLLGIDLTDADVTEVPLVATDEYGRFLPGPKGFVQIVRPGPDGSAGTRDDRLVEGSRSSPVGTGGAVGTGHAFLDDIAHDAVPTGKVADGDTEVSLANLDDSDTTGNYDNELLEAHFLAGDGRSNENVGLTAVHHVFHAEHNRLVEDIKGVISAELDQDPGFVEQWLLPGADVSDGIQAGEWNGERLFQAARFATEMQYQHLVFENFARRIQPGIDEFEAHDVTIDPAITAEFADAVYRFGHSLLRETVDRVDASGAAVDADRTTAGTQQLDLVDAFLNPLAYAERGVNGEAAAEIVRGASGQVANEIDELVTNALRNNLLGLPLDLAAINIARGRDVGIPPLNEVRREFYEATHDADLKPYASWAEFGAHLKHPMSLVNFVAAYGIHPLLKKAETLDEKRAAAIDIVLGRPDDPATAVDESRRPDADFLNGTGRFAGRETGLNDIDLWIGGLAEKPLSAGGLLGPTFNFVFETQLEELQNGDRFYYLSRLEGTNFLNELEATSFSELVMRNTGTTHLPFDVFSVPAHTIEAGDPSTFPKDPATGEALVEIGRAGAVRYVGDGHVVLGGTADRDVMRSAAGDDTLWGDDGDDKLDGGPGKDAVIGGDGDDRLRGGDGDDFANGANGDDRISGGSGADLLVGLDGKDAIRGGTDADEIFGGLGDDDIRGGDGDDELLGNEGDDVVAGGAGNDHLVGDNGNPFGEPLPDFDAAVFLGSKENFSFNVDADGALVVTDRAGNQGSDTLLNFEELRFDDSSISVETVVRSVGEGQQDPEDDSRSPDARDRSAEAGAMGSIKPAVQVESFDSL